MPLTHCTVGLRVQSSRFTLDFELFQIPTSTNIFPAAFTDGKFILATSEDRNIPGFVHLLVSNSDCVVSDKFYSQRSPQKNINSVIRIQS